MFLALVVLFTEIYTIAFIYFLVVTWFLNGRGGNFGIQIVRRKAYFYILQPYLHNTGYYFYMMKKIINKFRKLSKVFNFYPFLNHLFGLVALFEVEGNRFDPQRSILVVHSYNRK